MSAQKTPGPKVSEVVLRLTLSEARLVQGEMQYGIDVGAESKDYRRILTKVKRAITKATGSQP